MNNAQVSYLLDSFAVLAYLDNEAGMTVVKERLRQAESGDCHVYFCLINLGEVLYITERERGIQQARAVLAIVEQVPLTVLPVNRELVLAAAHVKASYPLSYADAFAIAAAQEKQATILTGDPEFRTVEPLVTIEWLPQK